MTRKKSAPPQAIGQSQLPGQPQRTRQQHHQLQNIQLKQAVSAAGVKRPVAPAVYRPLAKPLVAQAKAAGPSPIRLHPVAPPAYRPQATPRVLQTKKAGYQDQEHERTHKIVPPKS